MATPANTRMAYFDHSGLKDPAFVVFFACTPDRTQFFLSNQISTTGGARVVVELSGDSDKVLSHAVYHKHIAPFISGFDFELNNIQASQPGEQYIPAYLAQEENPKMVCSRNTIDRSDRAVSSPHEKVYFSRFASPLDESHSDREYIQSALTAREIWQEKMKEQAQGNTKEARKQDKDCSIL